MKGSCSRCSVGVIPGVTDDPGHVRATAMWHHGCGMYGKGQETPCILQGSCGCDQRGEESSRSKATHDLCTKSLRRCQQAYPTQSELNVEDSCGHGSSSTWGSTLTRRRGLDLSGRRKGWSGRCQKRGGNASTLLVSGEGCVLPADVNTQHVLHACRPSVWPLQ